MSTIIDVARQAGVSVSTISNVLNGRVDRMRGETLHRCEAAIGRLADPSVAPEEFLFKPSLVERDSLAAPRKATRIRK